MSFFCCLRSAFTFERGFNQTLSSMIVVDHQKVFFLRPFFISMLLRLINIKVHIISTFLFLVQLVKQASDIRRLGAVLSCIQLCMTFIIEQTNNCIFMWTYYIPVFYNKMPPQRIERHLKNHRGTTQGQNPDFPPVPSEIVNIICATSTSAVISLLSCTERNT